MNGIGNTLAERGDYVEALLQFERTLVIRTDIGDRQGIAGALHNIGWTLRLSGKISEARRYLEQSLEITTTISERVLAAYNTSELGLIAEAESQTLGGTEREAKRAEAQALIEEALTVFRELKQVKETAKWEKELDRIIAG